MSKHPMPWAYCTDHCTDDDSETVIVFRWLADAKGNTVMDIVDSDIAARIVALTEVAVAAGKFFRAKHGSSADLVKAGEQVEAKLAALEALQ